MEKGGIIAGEVDSKKRDAGRRGEVDSKKRDAGRRGEVDSKKRDAGRRGGHGRDKSGPYITVYDESRCGILKRMKSDFD